MSERVIAAWAEKCSGPGWANEIVWVLRREDGGRLYLNAIQPQDHSATMRALLAVSATVAEDMRTAVVEADDDALRAALAEKS